MFVKLFKAWFCQERGDHFCFSFVCKVKKGHDFFFPPSELLQSSTAEIGDNCCKMTQLGQGVILNLGYFSLCEQFE